MRHRNLQHMVCGAVTVSNHIPAVKLNMENEKQMRANMDNKKDYELADKLRKDLYDELAGRKQLFQRFDL